MPVYESPGHEEEDNDDAFKDNCIDPPVRVRLATQEDHALGYGRAPTMTIEVVRIGRPLKVLSLFLAILALALMIVASCAAHWMYTKHTRMGLFQECFTTSRGFECSWTSCITLPFFICMIVAVTSLGIQLVAIIIFVSAMLVFNLIVKTHLYNTTMLFQFLGMLSYLACVIVYPIFFVLHFSSEETANFDHKHGQVVPGWALILAIVAILILFISSVLLIADKRGDEIVYKEKVIRDSS